MINQHTSQPTKDNDISILKPEINSIKIRLLEGEADSKSKSKTLEAMQLELIALRNDNKNTIDGLEKQYASRAKTHEDEMLRLKTEIESIKQLITGELGSKFEANTKKQAILASSTDNQPTIDELKEIESSKNQLTQAETNFKLKLEAKELEMVNLRNDHQQMIDRSEERNTSLTKTHEDGILRLKTEIESSKNQFIQAETDFKLKLESKSTEITNMRKDLQQEVELTTQYTQKANTYEN